MPRIRTAGDVRRGELTAKDMTPLREADSARTQRKMTRGVLRDYSLSHRVEIDWNLNIEAERDQVFKLRVDDYEVLLDKEELLRHLRWV